MTLPATSERFASKIPSASERDIAEQLLKALAAQKAGEAELYLRRPDTSEPVKITLLPAVGDVLMDVLRVLQKGDAVTLVPVSQMLTTQQAADLLNMSRPHLIKIIEEGHIPFDKVGRHRRLQAKDVFAYRDARAAARSEALSELAKADADYL